jgi:putative transposase
MVTAGTYKKLPYFQGHERLTLLQDLLLAILLKYGWQVQAWAVFVNHYHFVARASGIAIKHLIKELHAELSREANKLDKLLGRQVWFQYGDHYDTILTTRALQKHEVQGCIASYC